MAYRRSRPPGDNITNIRDTIDQLANQAKASARALWKGRDYDGYQFSARRVVKRAELPPVLRRALDAYTKAAQTLKDAGYDPPALNTCGAPIDRLTRTGDDPEILRDRELWWQRSRAIEALRVKVHTDITGLTPEKARPILLAAVEQFDLLVTRAYQPPSVERIRTNRD